MTRTKLTSALQAARIIFNVEPDHVFVRFQDAPENSPKGRVIAKMMKAVRCDIADKGIVFQI